MDGLACTFLQNEQPSSHHSKRGTQQVSRRANGKDAAAPSSRHASPATARARVPRWLRDNLKRARRQSSPNEDPNGRQERRANAIRDSAATARGGSLLAADLYVAATYGG
eukprot:363036-Chlamydomonas_euryale.AAC.2